jgi:hypothetical protein
VGRFVRRRSNEEFWTSLRLVLGRRTLLDIGGRRWPSHSQWLGDRGTGPNRGRGAADRSRVRREEARGAEGMMRALWGTALRATALSQRLLVRAAEGSRFAFTILPEPSMEDEHERGS